MIQDFNLHTHTIEFDGKNTAAEMVDVAVACGIKTVGFSNHFIVHKNITGTNFYSYAVLGGYKNIYSDNFDKTILMFKKHYQDLEQVAAQKKVKILRGMEVDYFPNVHWVRGFENAMRVLKPDYLIGACHLFEFDGRLCNIHDIKMADADTQDKMLTVYWRKIQEIVKSGMFTFLAHIDLPRRVNLGLDDKWIDIEQQVVDVIAKNKIPVEINTALYKYCGQPHPTNRIMKMCADANVSMFLSDDSHHISQVARNFEDAKKYADDFGVRLIGLDKII
ncbi:MAG: PHP domain-containing protein [Alphaproteobacteria bacterium]|nr:PHP domain-containing protein [Alphaproteobacteria bacterium]